MLFAKSDSLPYENGYSFNRTDLLERSLTGFDNIMKLFLILIINYFFFQSMCRSLTIFSCIKDI